MTKNNKFIALLQLINLNLPELQTGKIEEVTIKKEELNIKISLSFSNVLDVKMASELIFRIGDYFINNFHFFNVSTNFLYDNKEIEESLLLSYYNYFIYFLSKEKPRYSVLNSFNYSCKDNEIIIYVATDEEIKIIEDLLVQVRDLITTFGLSVTIRAAISTFETPIEQIIKENMKATDQELMLEQKNFEQFATSNNQEAKPEEKKSRFKKVPRAKSDINREATPLKKIPASETEVIEYRQRNGNCEFVIIGDIISSNVKEITSRNGEQKTYKIYEALITDNEDTILAKTFINLNVESQVHFYEAEATVGNKVRVFGYVEWDRFANDVVLKITDMILVGEAEKSDRVDNAKVKRVELHAHSKMTVQDGVMDIVDYVKQAKKFNHRALAITDLYNIHVFPEFHEAAKKNGLLPILGLEGALVDENKFKIALNSIDINLRDATYVVYDLETTGLSSNYNEIIEIAAAKLKNGLIIDEFSTYVKPKNSISDFITDLTSITNDDVRGADSIEIVLPKFKAFFDGCILVAHNATFDNSHLYENMKRLNIYEGEVPTIDTLQLAKVRYGDKLKKFNLKAVSKYFDVELTQHHRAIYDAKATANFFVKMLHDFIDDGITNYNQINSVIDDEAAFKLAYPTHFTILSKNAIGKKNLYKIISDSHTTHFFKEARILKKFLTKYRDGLLIGSGCMNGEVFETAYEKGYEELLEVMKFYDYIEIQPPTIYEVLVEKNKDTRVREYIKDTIKKIIKAAKALGKLVVATGDVHHLNKEDVVIRQIYVDAPKLGGGTHNLSDVDNLPSFHFMSTDEMLNEFKFLPEELAYEIVVTNTNIIADKIETYELFPSKLFAPGDDSFKDFGIPSFKDGVINMSKTNAKKIYGENLPKYIVDRIEKELNSIIGNNFASIYYISHLLVKHSTDAGYVVGSRGSVGSSFIAFLMNITEVNPLPPHYFCKKCHFNAIKYNEEERKVYPRIKEETLLDDKLEKADTGYDLDEANCPICGSKLEQDGVGIPFETFLGFKGDKVPDIDLNFSGEYQSRAHEFCRELFGEDNAFRAGTISTIADKTAYGYVKKYFEKKGIQVRNAEINRLVTKVAGVKRSTGQHPGGIVVIPKDIEYTDIVPIQYPADDTTSSWRTTHFDYHKFETNLLKLDILGHDDPTMIRHLMNFVEKYPDEFPFSKVEEIPLTDKDVFGIFSGLETLHIKPEQMNGETIGTTGIPEFGTSNTKNMLSEIRPRTVSDLLKISGLSHGEGIWNGNSRDLFLELNPNLPKVEFKDLIGCRDDIMVYLISKNVPAPDAFKIMESVRKGKGVSKDFEKIMLNYNVPRWYIESCKLIKYMFPKAHATAYVIMALRIGWFKVHRPIFYYAAYFSRRADAFDVVAMVKGYESIKVKLNELSEKIENKNSSIKATAKEVDTHYSLLLSLEMTARGYRFIQMDINLSDATNFLVSKDRMSLLIPFNALESLGDATAISIVNARKEAPFTSKKDIMRRTKVNNTQFERMNAMGVFGSLPEDDQIGLFNIN